MADSFMGDRRRLQLLQLAAHSAFLQAVYILFYIAGLCMVGTLKPLPFQDYGKLLFTFGAVEHKFGISMLRRKLIDKPSAGLIRQGNNSAILESDRYLFNRAGQQLYTLYMFGIIQRIKIPYHFAALNPFYGEGKGKNRVFGLLLVIFPYIIFLAAIQIDVPLPQGIGTAGP